MKSFLTGNQAVAETVKLCRPDVVAAYPITPQTPIYERLSELEADGALSGVMMRMESEHSAMAALIAASLTGARTFTATSSQGVALMHEMLHFAAGGRVPVVMALVNRTLALPWAFWADQTDSLAQRDTGWMQIYAENNQESVDAVIQAFKIAETVLLPVMVVLEANVISHFMEPVDIPDPDRVDRFLAGSRVPARLDPDRPAFVGGVVNQKQFRDYRRLSQAAMQEAAGVMEAVGRDFGDVFGRRAGLIEAVDVEDADLVLVTAGTITSTARHTIDRIKRRSGVRIGLLKIRVFRPFPKDAVRNAVRGAGRFAVIDRNVSLGGEGIFCSEFKAALIHHPGRPRIQGYLAGIGGTDVDPDAIERVINDALNREEFSDQPIWVTEDE